MKVNIELNSVSLYWIVIVKRDCIDWYFPAPRHIRSSPGRESCDADVFCDGGQPSHASPLSHRNILLHPHVHRFKRSPHRSIPQVHSSETGVPIRRGVLKLFNNWYLEVLFSKIIKLFAIVGENKLKTVYLVRKFKRRKISACLESKSLFANISNLISLLISIRKQ